MKRWLLLAAALVGCSHAATPTSWIDRAREAHQRADTALARGDLDGGRIALRELVDATPPGTITLEDRRVVLQDALYRLAEIENSDRRPQAALAWADRGLAFGGRDVFYANLLVARGHAREQLGEDTWALTDYHDALVINDELLQKALPQ
jgi:hypothetical protein